jgi:hypothetical protein
MEGSHRGCEGCGRGRGPQRWEWRKRWGWGDPGNIGVTVGWTSFSHPMTEVKRVLGSTTWRQGRGRRSTVVALCRGTCPVRRGEPGT